MPRTGDAAGECDSNATLCDNCCKAMQMRLVCARCKTATYCSKDCQIKAWKAGHKGECVAAARASTGTAAALRDFSKAIEYHTQCLAIAKEVGDQAGRARHTGTSATRTSLGTLSKAIKYTRSTWRLQRRWTTGRGRATRTRASAIATCT